MSERDESPVDIQVDAIVVETERAIQVSLSETGDLAWIPKSVIHDDSEVWTKTEAGGMHGGKLVIFEWFAEREKLL